MKRILPEFEYTDQQLHTINELARACNLTTDTVKILYGRGVDTKEKIEHFIHPSKAHFLSPFLMSGMKETIAMIQRAKEEEWVVVVYGDYDADGICASTIMRGALRDYGIEPIVYVPERKNGYGLSIPAIDEIFEEHCPQLFITVDCGISNAEEIEYIIEQGAEVVVTDHHELPLQIPKCICVNPKFDDDYPFDNLCGAGVAFKVACALHGESAYKYLDFAAIATVADSVPLLNENRDIVHEGLQRINANPRSSYAGFLSKTGEKVTAQTLAFSIAPKINAAGRLGDAAAALNLFSAELEKDIFDLSARLTAYNTERQKKTDELYMSAKAKLAKSGAYGRVIMLWDESWNSGFVGIAAARLADEYGRPALLFVKNGDMLKGSARSIESVNIFDALRACSEHIAEFGGHSQAAGVNISIENFELLEKALNDYLHEHYTPDDFVPTLLISGTLRTQYSAKFIRELEMLEPYGVGNKRPLFVLEEKECKARPLKPMSKHLSIKNDKIELTYYNGVKYMRMIDSNAPKKFVFEYNINVFRGKEYFKGYVKDIIYDSSSGRYAPREILMNNMELLTYPQVNCTIESKPCAEIDQLIADGSDYGTILIACEYETLRNYRNLRGYNFELFQLTSRNLANTVLVSPSADVDLSGYKRIIYLDRPYAITLPNLEGKEIIICNNVYGTRNFKYITEERAQLLKIFAVISANAYNFEGSTPLEVATKNQFEFENYDVLFALLVFEQLKLISFEGGKLTVFRGIKTELNHSQLYRMVVEGKE